jgi:glycerophosphoryl diester phosphodiesterase
MTTNRSTEIIAHRGASSDAPENTLAAFQLGLDQGADAIECDVHLSTDDELVVIHDPDVKRIAGIDRAVKDMTVNELKALDVQIPTLREVLELTPTNHRIFIEVKCGMSAVEPLQKLLAQTALPMSKIILMEFDLETVITMKQQFPDAEILWLNDFHPLSFPWSRRRFLNQIIDTTRRQGLDGINLQNIPQLDARFIASCKKAQLTCYCWTVDDADRAVELIKIGIDGIATNRPGWMREQLNLSN